MNMDEDSSLPGFRRAAVFRRTISLALSEKAPTVKLGPDCCLVTVSDLSFLPAVYFSPAFIMAAIDANTVLIIYMIFKFNRIGVCGCEQFSVAY